MSDTVTTLSLLTLAQQYRGDIVATVNRTTALLKMIPIKAGEGKNIAWVPEFDGALAENYADGADAANFGSDAQTSAVLSWGLYRGGIHVTNLALDASASSSTPLGNKQRWAESIVQSCGKLASLVNGKCYTGPGTGTEMSGLDVALADDNTYAGIDRTDSANAKFRATVVDPGVSTAPTLALLRDDIRQVYEACGENPDMAGCAPAVFNKVGGLFDATRRNVVSTSTARGRIELDGGFYVIELDGTMFFKDKDATANKIYYLNSNYVHVEYLPSAEQRMLMAAGVAMVQADDGFGPVPLGFKFEKLAKTGASEKGSVYFTGNIVVKRPNACGVRKNVSTS